MKRIKPFRVTIIAYEVTEQVLAKRINCIEINAEQKTLIAEEAVVKTAICQI
jgi:hypothetical protein